MTREALSSWDDEQVASIQLLVSELVTNAVLHGAPPLSLSIDIREAGSVRISVSDASPAPPVLEAFNVDSHRGRGLALVDALADEWGVEPVADDGKSVWFEVAASKQDGMRGVSASR